MIKRKLLPAESLRQQDMRITSFWEALAELFCGLVRGKRARALAEQAVDERFNHADGLRDGGANAWAQRDLVGFQYFGFAAHEVKLSEAASERSRELEDRHRVEAMGIEARLAADRLNIRLDKVDSAGSLSAWGGIDQDYRRIPVGDRIGEIVATDAKIPDQDSLGKGKQRQLTDDFDTEGVISRENIPNARDQNFPIHFSSLTGSTSSTP